MLVRSQINRSNLMMAVVVGWLIFCKISLEKGNPFEEGQKAPAPISIDRYEPIPLIQHCFGVFQLRL